MKTGIDFEEFQKDFKNLRDWRIQQDTTYRANKCKAIYRVKCSPHFTRKMIGCEQTQDRLSLTMQEDDASAWKKDFREGHGVYTVLTSDRDLQNCGWQVGCEQASAVCCLFQYKTNMSRNKTSSSQVENKSR